MTTARTRDGGGALSVEGGKARCLGGCSYPNGQQPHVHSGTPRMRAHADRHAHKITFSSMSAQISWQSSISHYVLAQHIPYLALMLGKWACQHLQQPCVDGTVGSCRSQRLSAETACVTSHGSFVTICYGQDENRWRGAMGKTEFPIAESGTTSMSRLGDRLRLRPRVRSRHPVENLGPSTCLRPRLAAHCILVVAWTHVPSMLRYRDRLLPIWLLTASTCPSFTSGMTQQRTESYH